MWRSGKMMINDDHLWKFWGRSKQLNSVSSFHLSSNTRPFSSSVAIFVPWVLETRVLPRRSEPPSFGFRGRAVLTVRSGDVWGPGRSCAPWTLSPLFSSVKHGWEVPSPGEIAIFTCKILGKYGEKPLEMKVYSRNIIFGDFPASHVSLPEGSHQQLSRQATYLELWCHTTPSAGMDHPPSSFHLSSHPWWGVCSFQQPWQPRKRRQELNRLEPRSQEAGRYNSDACQSSILNSEIPILKWQSRLLQVLSFSLRNSLGTPCFPCRLWRTLRFRVCIDN